MSATLSIDLVIFDCDGVLVDSEVISNTVLAQTLTASGLPTTLDESLAEYQGLLLSEVVTRAESKLGRSLPNDFLARFQRDRTEAFRRELRPVSGAANAVRQVSAAGVGVCVASQGELEKTRLTLGLTGLRDLFEARALFSAYAVPRGKPHPDLFLHAASTMGVAPSACIVVEDSPSGIMAAVAAGMRAVGYSTNGKDAVLRDVGAEVIHSMDALLALLGVA